jgi:hypothetical protein
MSDYLTRIVERAGSFPAAVRPVLPTRFEPVRGGSGFSPETAAQGTEPMDGTENNMQPTLEAGSRSASMNQRIASIQSLWATASMSETPCQIDAPTNRTSADTLHAQIIEPALEVLEAESPAGTATPAESPHKADRAVSPPPAQRVESAQSRPPTKGEEYSPPASPPPQNAEPMSAVSRAVRVHSTVIPARTMLPSAVLPSVSRGRSRADTPRLVQANSAPAPVIHVAIGRVEVRAITPPAAPAAQRPERLAPNLSLDDYLRARNGGGA